MFLWAIIFLLVMYCDALLQIYRETIDDNGKIDLTEINNTYNQYTFWGFILGIEYQYDL